MYRYKTSGVCSREVQLDIENGKIKDIKTIGGCDGNLKGICSLVRGKDALEVMRKMKGIRCCTKSTSCPDQIAKAIYNALQQQQSEVGEHPCFDALSDERKIELLRKMILSRVFEEKVNEMFMKGMIHGTTHLGIGQEANHIGVSAALDENDWILPTHRGHGHFIGKGGNPDKMMKELFALKSGACKGLGGSMHLTDLQHHNMGSSGIVGGAVPLAVGMAFALKYKNSDEIVLSLFGDGATNEGMVLESFNLASVWQVPVLFYCENNMYGMSAPAQKFIAGGSIVKRAEAFGIDAVRIDGNNLVDVYETVSRAAEYIRKYKKPYLIESSTYRFLGHSKSDLRKYRTKEEEEEWKERCPIKRYKEFLMEKGLIEEMDAQTMEHELIDEIDAIVEDCIQHKDQILTIDEALSLVYKEGENE